ncbi:AraC family transcriptional regulator [Paenibacillus contaminans]|uniref:AraC family transcriptional regulator n=1 Tax=Paenibacillus contaminans TaxID=450362 RepID=A0A329M2R3_9BACL|nr:AraC family transcriptional regulator [Paenibacillus contaminans]RAV14465.1 AraC family transcriptional regulator [Paenibacillus contaminans]
MAVKRFPRTSLTEYITIRQIVSFHYFEFSKDFMFDGEKHNFWEFVYVDRGEVEALAETDVYLLKQGDIIFHKPNEHHNLRANRKIAPNVMIVSFVCHSPAMSVFENKIFSLNSEQQHLLVQILKSGFAAFVPPFDDPRNHQLHRNPEAHGSAEQLLKIHLELLMIRLLEHAEVHQKRNRLSGEVKQQSDRELIKEVIAYMEQHVFQNIRIERICKIFNISRSNALSIFKEKTGQSMMQYFRRLKIEQAKRMIRENTHNMTEIADLLNYSSVHSFSRQFKTNVQMSPIEYARMIKAKM